MSFVSKIGSLFNKDKRPSLETELAARKKRDEASAESYRNAGFDKATAKSMSQGAPIS